MGSNSQQPPPSTLEGLTIAGKYLLLRRLGEGGMCTVYEAEHVGLRQGLALKVLKPELADDAGCVARFESEARAAAQLRSPNVARVFDVDWLPTGQPYITMELLIGNDLGHELTRAGRLPIDLAVDYVRQACAGMAEAHALGIVHRDLKPENLFLTDLGELTDRKLLKILDFGIAKDISDSARRLTAPDAVFGTVDYMSPEQIRSASKVDHRSDLWSLGVILYELLTGRTPYHGDARSVIAQIVSDPVRPPTTLVPDLPPSLVATVMKALHKDPALRFQTADELRAELAGYSEFEPITSVIAKLPPQSVPRRAARSGASASVPPEMMVRDQRTHASWETKPERRSRGRAWVVVAVTATLLGAGAGILYNRGLMTSWTPWRKPAVVRVTAAPALAATATVLPTAALVPSATPSAAGSAAASLVALPAPPDPSAGSSSVGADPSAVPSASSSAKAKPPRPRPTVARPTAAPPPPPPPTAEPRLPKHI